MGWVGPNGRVYKKKQWVVFATIGAAAVAVATWIKSRIKNQRESGAG
jgi:hypothetical protein